MNMFDSFFLDTDLRCCPSQPHRLLKRPLIVRILNIALAGLAAFTVVGSASCAFRIVFSH